MGPTPHISFDSHNLCESAVDLNFKESTVRYYRRWLCKNFKPNTDMQAKQAS